MGLPGSVFRGRAGGGGQHRLFGVGTRRLAEPRRRHRLLGDRRLHPGQRHHRPVPRHPGGAVGGTIEGADRGSRRRRSGLACISIFTATSRRRDIPTRCGLCCGRSFRFTRRSSSATRSASFCEGFRRPFPVLGWRFGALGLALFAAAALIYLRRGRSIGRAGAGLSRHCGVDGRRRLSDRARPAQIRSRSGAVVALCDADAAVLAVLGDAGDHRNPVAAAPIYSST